MLSQESTNAIARSREAIIRIGGAIGRVMEMNNMIAASAEEQAATSRQVDDNVRTLVERSHEAQGVSTQTGEAAEELNILIKRINDEVSQYTVGKTASGIKGGPMK
ncbi:MAG TPA: hypothetical protein VL091_10545 [Marinobacter sp.]|nr:hypothetical protein [Marinobacter sp.]